MKILVLGAEGFVGSNLVKKLVDKHDIVALDYLTSREHSNIPLDVQYINCDLSVEDLGKLPAVDLVIHLAAISIERISETPTYKNVNSTAMFKILEYTEEHGADLIFSSTGSVYGSGVNFTEASPLNPLSAYATGKILDESLVGLHCGVHDLNATILRYSNCYGDTTYLDNKFYPGKKGVMRIFMENAIRGKPLPLIRGQSRDFTFIDDVVEATVSMVGRCGCEIFNVATGIETNIYDIPPRIGRALGKSVDVEIKSPRAIDNLTRRSLNIDKISEFWTPKYSLNEGIEEYARRMQ